MGSCNDVTWDQPGAFLGAYGVNPPQRSFAIGPSGATPKAGRRCNDCLSDGELPCARNQYADAVEAADEFVRRFLRHGMLLLLGGVPALTGRLVIGTSGRN